MTGLDTNILVSWLLGAVNLNSISKEGSFRISYVALAELAWVFSRRYKYSKTQIVEAIEILQQTADIRFPDERIVLMSLEAFRDGNADFADYLLMFDGEAAGCHTTLTFDKKAGKHAGFTLLTEEG